MIKSELIQKIAAANQHLYHRDIERIVNVVFNEIVEALARGDRVELQGLRRLHGEAPRAPRRSQPAHRRVRVGGREVRAVLQDRQGPARAAERCGH